MIEIEESIFKTQLKSVNKELEKVGETEDTTKREELEAFYTKKKENLEKLIEDRDKLKTPDRLPYINYTPPNYYFSQMEGETDEQYKERKDSYKDYDELTKFFRDSRNYEGDLDYIQKALDKYREHIVNLEK